MDIRLATAASVANPVQHDIELSNERMTLVDGNEAIAQHLRVRLQFFLGEWFLDISEGIPFFREVFTKITSQTVVRSIFRQVIVETPGISQVSEFNFQYNPLTREANLQFDAVLDDGTTLTSEDFGQFTVEV